MREQRKTCKMASSSLKFAEFNMESDDWILYEERLEQYLAASNIKENESRTANLISVLGTQSYKLLRNLCFPLLPKEKKYEELCKLLREHCCPKANVWKERRRFYEAKQEAHESIADWYVKIQSLSANCRFDANLSSILKDKFISGLIVGPIFERLCEEKEDQTLERLKEIAAQRESTNVRHLSSDMLFVKKPQNYGNGANQGGRSRSQNRMRKGRNRNFSPKANDVDGDRRNRNDNRHQDDSHHANSCKICGNKHRGFCKFRNYDCDKCGKRGHLAKVCRKKQVNFMDDEYDDDEEDLRYVAVDSNSNPSGANIYVNNEENYRPLFNLLKDKDKDSDFRVNIKINNANINMLLDSGSSVSCMNENVYKNYFKNKHNVNKDNTILRSYNGSVFAPLGFFVVNVCYLNVCRDIKFHVVPNGGPCILGRDFLRAFNLKIGMINIIDKKLNNETVNKEIQKLTERYSDVFTDRLGHFKHSKISLRMDENANPVFLKPRSVPLAYQKPLDEQLNQMIEEGILTPIETSDWATPLVPIIKSDGKIRICADYKSTVNKYLKEDVYPLPRAEDLFAKLHNGEEFTKLDLCQAYNQFELDDEAKKLLVWSTHKGLLQMNRMPFGIAPASSKFQRYIEQILQGVENVAVYIDDIIITGSNREKHLETLEKVLNKLKNAGLTVRFSKCSFFQPSVTYLGHRITKDGLMKTDDKIKAILNAPEPTNVSEVRTLLGMVSYYGKFIPNLSSTLHPLYRLLKKNVTFNWDSDCKKTFKKIKELIASDIVLTHFNPKLPIFLTTDASDNGIAAVLSHKMPNGDERPVCFISRTLLQSEKKMSTIHKEALSIYFSVTRLHHYLIGRKWTLRTDHKPLCAIFGKHKGIPKMYENRLQRWAAYLSGFDYEIQYIKGKLNTVADYLSRFPKAISQIDVENDKMVSYLYFTNNINEWPLNNEDIRKETQIDNILSKVKKCIEHGKWPKNLDKDVKPYFDRRNELFIENGTILWGLRIVIPQKLQGRLLQELHVNGGHFGASKMKNRARSIFYWPGLDAEIEKIASSCNSCLINKPAPPKTKLTPWPIEKEPFNRIHIDYLQIGKNYILIIIDAYSKWIEAFLTKTTTTKATNDFLRQTFARFGLPVTLVSDNGPQFTSEEFESFLSSNGIKHVTTPPYNSQSNGLAENAVKTCKNKIYTYMSDPENRGIEMTNLLSRFLFNYRITPHTTTGKSPSLLMFGREFRSRLTLLKENNKNTTPTKTKEWFPEVQENMLKAQETQKRNYGGVKRKLFNKDQSVFVRDYRNNKESWIKAKIEKQIGKSTFKCKIEEGNVWKRHANQIRAGKGEGSGERKMERQENTFSYNNDKLADFTNENSFQHNTNDISENVHINIRDNNSSHENDTNNKIISQNTVKIAEPPLDQSHVKTSVSCNAAPVNLDSESHLDVEISQNSSPRPMNNATGAIKKQYSAVIQPINVSDEKLYNKFRKTGTKDIDDATKTRPKRNRTTNSFLRDFIVDFD